MAQIFKDAITQLPSRGKITLQIPDLEINTGNTPGKPLETVPDNWICVLRNGFDDFYGRTLAAQPATGNEQGFPFLTSIGWNANKSKIEQAFKTSPELAHLTPKEMEDAWKSFEDHAQKHFKSLRKSIKAETAKAKGHLHAARLSGNKRSQKYWKKKVFELRSFVV